MDFFLISMVLVVWVFLGGHYYMYPQFLGDFSLSFLLARLGIIHYKTFFGNCGQFTGAFFMTFSVPCFLASWCGAELYWFLVAQQSRHTA